MTTLSSQTTDLGVSYQQYTSQSSSPAGCVIRKPDIPRWSKFLHAIVPTLPHDKITKQPPLRLPTYHVVSRELYNLHAPDRTAVSFPLGPTQDVVVLAGNCRTLSLVPYYPHVDYVTVSEHISVNELERQNVIGEQIAAGLLDGSIRHCPIDATRRGRLADTFYAVRRNTWGSQDVDTPHVKVSKRSRPTPHSWDDETPLSKQLKRTGGSGPQQSRRTDSAISSVNLHCPSQSTPLHGEARMDIVD